MISSHARKRLQQRGISISKVEAILQYGQEYHVKKATSYINNKDSEKMMADDGISSSFVDACRGIYVVCDGETVITVAHKH